MTRRKVLNRYSHCAQRRRSLGQRLAPPPRVWPMGLRQKTSAAPHGNFTRVAHRRNVSTLPPLPATACLKGVRVMEDRAIRVMTTNNNFKNQKHQKQMKTIKNHKKKTRSRSTHLYPSRKAASPQPQPKGVYPTMEGVKPMMEGVKTRPPQT